MIDDYACEVIIITGEKYLSQILLKFMSVMHERKIDLCKRDFAMNLLKCFKMTLKVKIIENIFTTNFVTLFIYYAIYKKSNIYYAIYRKTLVNS